MSSVLGNPIMEGETDSYKLPSDLHRCTVDGHTWEKEGGSLGKWCGRLQHNCNKISSGPYNPQVSTVGALTSVISGWLTWETRGRNRHLPEAYNPASLAKMSKRQGRP